VSAADPAEEGLLAVISLVTPDEVEVRLLRPGAPLADPIAPGRRPIFGLFALRRRSDPCGF
jgi:hypothetical protein